MSPLPRNRARLGVPTVPSHRIDLASGFQPSQVTESTSPPLNHGCPAIFAAESRYTTPHSAPTLPPSPLCSRSPLCSPYCATASALALLFAPEPPPTPPVLCFSTPLSRAIVLPFGALLLSSLLPHLCRPSTHYPPSTSPSLLPMPAPSLVVALPHAALPLRRPRSPLCSPSTAALLLLWPGWAMLCCGYDVHCYAVC